MSAWAPTELDGGEDGTLRTSAIHTYGQVLHSFVDRRDYHGVFAPGFRKVKSTAPAADGLSLLEVDHCVGNVGLGEMDTFVDFYRDVLGFAQLIHYDDKVIHTDYSALMSKVMTNGNGRIKFPINEPATGKKKSQIQEYLDWYRSPGCQHIALRTEDIVGTVRRLRDLGVEFLGLPHEYYASLADRVGDVGVPIDTLEELGIEADRDEEGYLLQIFTPPGPGPPDVLLRDHRAPWLARLRRRQLQGAVRGDRARAGEAREPLERGSRAASETEFRYQPQAAPGSRGRQRRLDLRDAVDQRLGLGLPEQTVHDRLGGRLERRELGCVGHGSMSARSAVRLGSRGVRRVDPDDMLRRRPRRREDRVALASG